MDLKWKIQDLSESDLKVLRCPTHQSCSVGFVTLQVLDGPGRSVFFTGLVLVYFRSSSLSAVNAMLREQLEQAGLANEALSQDIRRLTADWTKAREELEQRESDWRREEEVRSYRGCSGDSELYLSAVTLQQ